MKTLEILSKIIITKKSKSFIILTTILLNSVLFAIIGCQGNKQNFKSNMVISELDSTLEIPIYKGKILEVKLDEGKISLKGKTWQIDRYDSSMIKLIKTEYDTTNKKRIFLFLTLQEGGSELVFRQQKIWQQNNSLNNFKTEKLFYKILTINK
ncbi:hypothetical protein AAEX28_03765 [Lentisphaerota bacterium WC36G]|nr:hypothetical protein LJT99_06640 [Lentisphaerae bacterium WC36]